MKTHNNSNSFASQEIQNQTYSLRAKRSSIGNISIKLRSKEEKKKFVPKFDFKQDYLNKTFVTNQRRRSPRLGKSGLPVSSIRDIRVSSNAQETDAGELTQRIAINSINHMEYKPELFEPKTIKRIRKIIREASPKGSNKLININSARSQSPRLHKYQSPRMPEQTTTNYIDRVIAE
jgi:hypothetical protein